MVKTSDIILLIYDFNLQRMGVNMTNGQLGAVDCKSVAQLVINKIIKGIQQHTYKAGDRLPTETELIEEFGISRSSVREAMKVLAALGIIEIRRGEGTFIANANSVSVFDPVVYSLLLEEAGAEETVEFRKHMDFLAVRLAAERCTEADIQMLEDLIVQMRKEFETGTVERIHELDLEFHMTVIRLSRNAYFIKLLTGLFQFFGPNFVYKSKNDAAAFRTAEMSHESIVRCLRTKDTLAYAKAQEQDREFLKTYFQKS